jgi:hypothetical protein
LKYFFSQLLNVHRISDVRYKEIHAAEPLAPKPYNIQLHIAAKKFKKLKLSDADQTAAKSLEAGGEPVRSSHQFYLKAGRTALDVEGSVYKMVI